MNTIPADPEKAKALIADIIRNVCEIPGRTSPDDEPEALICSVDELECCIERAFEKHLSPSGRDEDGDLLANLGDMTGFNLDSLKKIMAGGADNNHEAMVEEHIKVFNYAITQGIHPGQALLACVQAIGSLLGFAIRSGMHPNVASSMTALLIKTTGDAATQVQIVTTN